MMLICSFLSKDQDEARLMGGKEEIGNTKLWKDQVDSNIFFSSFKHNFAAIMRLLLSLVHSF